MTKKLPVRSGAQPCPSCDHSRSEILITKGKLRNRKCPWCDHRWTTYEIDEQEYHLLMAVQTFIGKNVKNWLSGRRRSK